MSRSRPTARCRVRPGPGWVKYPGFQSCLCLAFFLSKREPLGPRRPEAERGRWLITASPPPVPGLVGGVGAFYVPSLSEPSVLSGGPRHPEAERRLWSWLSRLPGPCSLGGLGAFFLFFFSLPELSVLRGGPRRLEAERRLRSRLLCSLVPGFLYRQVFFFSCPAPSLAAGRRVLCREEAGRPALWHVHLALSVLSWS